MTPTESDAIYEALCAGSVSKFPAGAGRATPFIQRELVRVWANYRFVVPASSHRVGRAVWALAPGRLTAEAAQLVREFLAEVSL